MEELVLYQDLRLSLFAPFDKVTSCKKFSPLRILKTSHFYITRHSKRHFYDYKHLLMYLLSVLYKNELCSRSGYKSFTEMWSFFVFKFFIEQDSLSYSLTLGSEALLLIKERRI